MVVTGAAEDSATINHSFRLSGASVDAIPAAGTVAVTVEEATPVVTAPSTSGVTISRSALSLMEGGSAVSYTVVLDTDPSATVTITPVSSDSDAVSVSAPLIFNSTNWETEQTVTLTPEDDINTSNESITVSHTISSGYSGVSSSDIADVTVTVNDDDVLAGKSINFSTTSATIDEGDSGKTDVTISVTFGEAPTTGSVGLNLTIVDAKSTALKNTNLSTTSCSSPQPATADFCYVGSLSDNTSINIPRGTTAGTFTLGILGDTDYEPDETITLKVSANPLFFPGWGERTMTLTITNDDDPPLAATQVPAKPAGLTATVLSRQATLTWTDPEDASITKWQYQQKVGGAAWGEWTDFPSSQASTKDHTFTELTDGTQYQFRVRAVNDAGNSAESEVVTATPELIKSVLTVSATQNGQADLSWTVSDTTPGRLITGAAELVQLNWRYRLRGAGSNNWKVVTPTLLPGLNLVDVRSYTHNYSRTPIVSHGAVVEYQVGVVGHNVGGALAFGPWSDTATATVIHTAEPALTLSPSTVDSATLTHEASGSTTGYNSALSIDEVSVTVTDTTPTLQLFTNSAAVSEGIAISLTVTSDMDLTGDVTVNLELAARSSSSFDADDITGTLGPRDFTTSFGSTGSKTGTVSIPTSRDAATEVAEAYRITLNDGSGYVRGTDYTADGTLNDGGTTSLSIADVTQAEGGTFSFTVTASPTPSSPITFKYKVTKESGDTATAGTDFTEVSTATAKTIAANAASVTITVVVTDDGLDELDETFKVTLLEPSTGVVLGDATATGTITDNDASPVLAEIANETIKLGQAVDITASATDGDGDTITYAWTRKDGEATPVLPGSTARNQAWLTFTTTAVGTYTMTVTANDGNGNTDTEEVVITVSAPVVTVPGKPTDLTATPSGDGEVRLRWTKPTGPITSYQLRYDKTGDRDSADWSVIPSADANTVSHSVENLENGEECSFRVRAIDDAGDGIATDWVTATPQPPTAGVTVLPTTLSLTEGGTTGSYRLVLTTNPSATVTVTPTSSDSGAVTVSAALTFTTANWDTAQSVTVTPVQDEDATDATVTVSHAISGYSGVSSVDAVTITVMDTIPTLELLNELSAVSEGTAISLTVTSDKARTGKLPVMLTLAVRSSSSFNADDIEGTLGPRAVSASFADSPGSTTGSVTIPTRIDDIVEGDENYLITITDGNGYAVGTNTTADGTINDGTTGSVTVSPTALTVAECGRTTYTIKLDNQPSADVTITVGGASGEVTGADSSLIFTPTNYSTAQTVTVNAASDDDATDDSVTLTHNANGGGYNSVSIAPMTVMIDDDDTAGVTVTPTSLSLTEGGTAKTYTVKLNTLPLGNVTVTPGSGDTGAVMVSGALTFTPSNWDTARMVTVTPVGDDDDDNETEDRPQVEARKQELVGLSRATLGMATDMIGARVGGDLSGSSAGAGAIGEQALGLMENLLWSSHGSELSGSLSLEQLGEQLWNQSFHISQSDSERAIGEQRGRWSLWGAGELRSFKGKDASDAKDHSYSGSIKAGWLGVDYQFSNAWLAGLAVSFSSAESDYTYRSQDNTGAGKTETQLTTFYPYGSLQLTERLKLWGTAGIGFGDLRHQSNDDDSQQDGELKVHLAAIGFEQKLSSLAAWNIFSLAGDLAFVQSSTEWQDGALTDQSVSITRARLGVNSSFPLSQTTTGYMNLRGRLDGGDLQMGAAEVVLGLRYSTGRFSAPLQGRQTSALDGSYSESGILGELRFATQQGGTGLALQLQPSYGPYGETGRQQASLTDDQQLDALTGWNGNGQPGGAMALKSTMGYGILLPDRDVLLTPFAEVAFTEGSRHQIGLGLSMEGSSWEVKLSGSREESSGTTPNGTLKVMFSKQL